MPIIPILVEEMRSILAKIAEQPMANALCVMFERHADPERLEAAGTSIRTGVQGYERCWQVISELPGGGVSLNLYTGSQGNIPMGGYPSNVFVDNPVNIIASAHDAGVWAYGRGNLMTYSIRVWVKGDTPLPSEYGQWIFGWLNEFAQLAGELHLEVAHQPKFWDGATGEDDDD